MFPPLQPWMTWEAVEPLNDALYTHTYFPIDQYNTSSPNILARRLFSSSSELHKDPQRFSSVHNLVSKEESLVDWAPHPNKIGISIIDMANGACSKRDSDGDETLCSNFGDIVLGDCGRLQ